MIRAFFMDNIMNSLVQHFPAAAPLCVCVCVCVKGAKQAKSLYSFICSVIFSESLEKNKTNNKKNCRAGGGERHTIPLAS